MSIKNVTTVVSELERHIIREILIPRIQNLPETEVYKEKSLEYYSRLLLNQEVLDSISAKTCGFIYKTFCGYSQHILDDMMSDIVSATIQDTTNEYRKVKKSTHGFWKSRFDLNPDSSSFSTSFLNVCFRAIQTSAKTFESRKKHETNDFVTKNDRNDDVSYVESVRDDRETELKLENMTGYDSLIYEMYNYVINQTDLDNIAKEIFRVWFSKKEDKKDFSVIVKMSSEVYPAVRQLMIAEGKKPLSPVSMHIRWKQVFGKIRDFLD